MIVAKFIKKLKQANVILKVVDNQLHCELPSNGFDEALKQELVRRKEEVKDFIKKASDGTQTASIPKAQMTETGILSFNQQRIMLIEQIDGNHSQYNIHGRMMINKVLCEKTLQKTLNCLLIRHQVLRSVYVFDGNEYIQRLLPNTILPYEKIDLKFVSERDKIEKIKAISKRESRTVFNLAKDIPIRLMLVSISESEHMMYYTIHHIASDEWSQNILLNEFNEIYQAISKGRENPLPPLDIQYADFAVWQKQWMSGARLESHIDYWRKELYKIPQVHNLPLDKPRARQKLLSGRQYTMRLSRAKSEKIKQFSRENNVTQFILLQTIYSVLLSRLSNETDIVMGTPVSGRAHQDTEKLIGLFVNTLVLRCRTQGNPTFKDLLQKQKKRIMESYRFQNFPFDMLANAIGCSRSLSYNPIFQMMFSLKETAVSIPVQDKPNDTDNIIANSTVKFDLELSILVYEDGMKMTFLYNSSLFQDESVIRLADRLETTIDSAVSNPELKINELPILCLAERRRLMSIKGRDSTVYQSQLLHKHIEYQAQKSPNNVAVVHENKSLSYAELNWKSNQLAHYLLKHEVKKGAIIAIIMENSIDMMIAILAALKAGTAYLPLSPNCPSERAKYILKDASVSLVLSQNQVDITNNIDKQKLLLVNSPKVKNLLVEFSRENLIDQHMNLKSDDLAYVIYTSGSTGKPKGVKITHKNVCHYVNFAIENYLTETMCGAVSSLSLSFDATVTSLFAPLCSGRQLVLVSDNRDLLDQLNHYLFGEKSWLFKLTPAHLELLGNASEKTDAAPMTASHIFVVGGEPLKSSTLIRLINNARFSPKSTVFNEYGPTEATVGSCIYPIKLNLEEVREHDGCGIPIGKPIDNTQLYILDDTQQLVAQGSIGELFIGGAGISQGYLNRKDLSKKSFVSSPFSNDHGEKLYKTGDRVRLRADGNLEFVGRIDHQVKLRGFRIELGEIESQILAIDGIKQCAVLVDHNQLKTFIVADNSFTADVSEREITIRTQLSRWLPDYMIPTIVWFLDKMPLTSNGKIDNESLRKLSIESNTNSNIHLPENERQEILCRIWSDVLEKEQVGINDNFFSLGGDSIRTMQVISKAKQSGLFFSTRDIFEYQTVKALAEKVSIRKVAEAPQSAVSGECQLLPIQINYLSKNLPEISHYNQSLLLKTPKGLGCQDARFCIEAIILRHDVLRVRFKLQEKKWRASHQAISEDMLKQAFEVHDLSEFTAETRKDRLIAISEQAQTKLDINHGPLFKVIYFRYPEGEGRLFLTCHHLVIDIMSWRIIVSDLELAYSQLLAKQKIKLPNKTSSFQQFTAVINKKAHTDEVEVEKGYWQSQLSKITQGFPCDFENYQGLVTLNQKKLGFSLSNENSELILGHCQSVYDASINELLLSALLMAYREFCKQSSLCLEMEGHGRDEFDPTLDVSETLGWFTTLYPLVLSMPEKDDIAEIVNSVKTQYRQVPNKGLGFGLLTTVREDKILRSLAKNTQKSKIIFNYFGHLDSANGNAGLFEIARETPGNTQSPLHPKDCQLVITGRVMAGCLSFKFNFLEGVHQEGDVHGFSQAFKVALNKLAMHSVKEKDVKLTVQHSLAFENFKRLNSDTIVRMNNTINCNIKMFCLHGRGGTVACYSNLAEGLSQYCQFYGVEAPDVYSEEKITDFHTLVKFHCHRIKQEQVTGPYYLIGWSLGGDLAYEVANQLKSEGHEIAYLAILDANPDFDRVNRNEKQWYFGIKKMFANTLDIDWKYLDRYSKKEGVRIVAENLYKAKKVPNDISNDVIMNYLNYLCNIDAIYCLSKVPRCDIDLHLIKVHRENIAADYGWSKYTTGKIDVENVAGDHFSILNKPYIDKVLNKIIKKLKSAININNEKKEMANAK